jgi:hypothetical protein
LVKVSIQNNWKLERCLLRIDISSQKSNKGDKIEEMENFRGFGEKNEEG